MRISIQAKVIASLDEAATGDAPLLAALLLLLGILQHPTTYPGKKARPITEFRELIHWTLLTFDPVSRHLKSAEGVQLPAGIRVRRVLADDGKFALELDGLFPAEAEDFARKFEYDVCLSFAGEQRQLAEQLASVLRNEWTLSVFYDDYHKLKLWGNDLFNYLYDIYSSRSQFCVILFSDEYLKKNWTRHELRAAQSRFLKERSTYVLPVLVEERVELPREFEAISHVSLANTTIADLSQEIHSRVWPVKGQHWLDQEEMAEIINEGMAFQLFVGPFRERLASSDNDEDRLLVLLLGVMWAVGQSTKTEQVKAIFEYLVFAYEPISKHFNSQGDLTILPPNGLIHRDVGRGDCPLLMKKDFWDPYIEAWRAQHPNLYEEASDANDGDKDA